MRTRLILFLFLGLLNALMFISCKSVDSREKYFGRANVNYIAGRYDLAERDYLEVLNIEPNCPEAEYNLADVYAAWTYDEKAKNYYQLAIKHYLEREKSDTFTVNDSEKLSMAYFQLAGLFLKDNMNDQAESQYLLATKYNKKDPKIYYNLGHVREALFKEKEAELDYKKAIEIDPTFAEAHLALAFIYEYSGDIDKAKEHHSIARQLGQDNDNLIKLLDWWSDWKTFTTREDPKVRVTIPPKWTSSESQGRVGRVLVNYDNIKAVCYGEGEGTIQIVGPDKNFSFWRRGAETPANYAKIGLKQFLKEKGDSELFHKEFTRQENEGSSGEATDELNDDFSTEKWVFDLDDMESYTFQNGVIGATMTVKVVWDNAVDIMIKYWFYLGHESSYVIVGTYFVDRMPSATDYNNKIDHALDYIAKNFDVLAEKKQ